MKKNVANRIRGVSKYNPAGRIYHKMSDWQFGPQGTSGNSIYSPNFKYNINEFK